MEEEKMSIRTDLALEAREIAGDIKTELKGIKVITEKLDELNMHITKVQVLDEDGEKQIHKPIGNYITIECEGIKRNSTDEKKDIVEAVANELKKIVDLRNKTILVIGLGNQRVTPDSLGPKVVANLIVTRHLFQEFEGMNDDVIQSVSAIAPGVMGQTGMETVEIVKGVVDTIKPDIVIAVDALASRRTNRVNTTIQIADTGVHPGSGVGNRRKGLTQKTLGVPVIAIGVPTVVDAATIVNDTMEELINQVKSSNGSGQIIDAMFQMTDVEKYKLIKEILYPYVGNLFVTPKEIDEVIERISDIVAMALNRTLHPDMEYEEIRSWLS
ncbi:MAG: GPR endopeptidase [Firmicutes bacterium HGW-Firmicutes-1]|jgi:spore protease|nr:MAG: GPR endopeptidase [Firmicutes bacterium HGW-Firmicutes-1]